MVIDLKTNQPTISGTVPTVKVIYVNSNATLTVSSGGTLNANSTAAVITLQGGNIINDGTINLSGGGSGEGISIGATANITNRGTITTNNLYGISLDFGNLTFTNESTGIVNGDFKANNNILTLTNQGTINYTRGSTYGLSLGSSGSSVINDGTISITVGSGISNPSGSSITNSACGKILMTTGKYENSGTTINAGLIQMPNAYNFTTNTGTFTNNGVLKAKTVTSITNNKMVITNACPIFTLGGTNNYTVNGIFTEAAATTSAGTYTSTGNKFTANNTIPAGSQTLYAQVTDGTCTFTVPFDFNNAKPTAVSVNKTTVCTGASTTLSGTCASGTLTWYTNATGGTSIGTGTGLSHSPTAATTYYAACESTNCISGRVATSAISIATLPTASPSSNSPVCVGSTLNLSSAVATSYLWTGPDSFSSTVQNPEVINVSIVKGGTYTLQVTDANSCTATASVSATVNALPTITATSNSPICSRIRLQFRGTGGGTYLWTAPNFGGTSAMADPFFPNATPSNSGTYTLKVTNASGCTATASVSVTVNASPVATATSNTPVLVGNALSLSSTGVGTYAWAGPTTFTSTEQNPVVSSTATTAASGTYTVTVSNSLCSATATTAVSVLMVTGGSNSPICVGTSLNLTSSGGTSYSWAGPNSFASTEQNPVLNNATAAVGGVYSVSIVSGAATITVTTSVTVNTLPTATASSNSPICSAASLNLSVTATGTAPLTYTWSGTGTFVNGTTAMPSVTGAATGNYTVSVSNSCGTATSTVAVTVNLQPTLTAGTAVNPTTCSGTNGSIPFTTNLANGTYSLSYMGIGTPKNVTVTNGAFSLSSLSAGAYSNFSVTNIGCTATDASSKTLSDPPAVLATNYQAMTLNFAGTINQIFNTSTCNILLALTPNGGNPVAGNVEAKVWVGSPAPTYVGRKFEITPASNPNTATAKVTLFVLQSEFTAFNNQSPTPARLLPTAPTDAAGIANVFIFKKAGTSSDNSGNPSTYAGAVTTIDPLDADIVWNNTESRWEISFQVSGFSGFVIGTPPLGCNLPNITQEPIAQKICNGQGFSLSIVANSATSYQWELNGVAIVGANANTYAIPVATANQLGTYTVVISNILATCAVRSANAIVEAKVSHFLQFQGCNCGGGGPLKVSIVGGTSPYSFDYMTSGGPSTFTNYLSGVTVTLPQNITQGRAISVTDAQGCKSID